MVLVHDVHEGAWHMIGDPPEHRPCAALDVARHHEVTDHDVLAPVAEECVVPRHGLEVPGRLREEDRAPVVPELEVREPDVDEGPEEPHRLRTHEHVRVPEHRRVELSLEGRKLGSTHTCDEVVRLGASRVCELHPTRWTSREAGDRLDDRVQVDRRLPADPVDVVRALRAEVPRDRGELSRGHRGPIVLVAGDVTVLAELAAEAARGEEDGPGAAHTPEHEFLAAVVEVRAHAGDGVELACAALTAVHAVDAAVPSAEPAAPEHPLHERDAEIEERRIPGRDLGRPDVAGSDGAPQVQERPRGLLVFGPESLLVRARLEPARDPPGDEVLRGHPVRGDRKIPGQAVPDPVPDPQIGERFVHGHCRRPGDDGPPDALNPSRPWEEPLSRFAIPDQCADSMDGSSS